MSHKHNNPDLLYIYINSDTQYVQYAHVLAIMCTYNTHMHKHAHTE